MKTISLLGSIGFLGLLTWQVTLNLKPLPKKKPQLQTLSLHSQVKDEALQNEIDKWEESSFQVNSVNRFTEMYSDEQDPGAFKYKMDLDVVILSGSGWSLKSIKERLVHMGEVLKTCKIKFENIYIVKIQPKIKAQINYYPWFPIEGGEGQEKASTYELSKDYPNTLKRASITYLGLLTSGDYGAAGAKWYFGPDSPMLYKQFVSIETESPLYKWRSHDNYSVEAHELGHVLFNINHKGTDNIMAVEPIKRSVHVRPEDCKKAVNHDLTQKIDQ